METTNTITNAIIIIYQEDYLLPSREELDFFLFCSVTGRKDQGRDRIAGEKGTTEVR